MLNNSLHKISLKAKPKHKSLGWTFLYKSDWQNR